MNEFSKEPFHVALARASGSIEFTYAELGLGAATVSGAFVLAYED